MNTGTYDTESMMPTREEEAVEMYLAGIHVADICVELALQPPALYLILRRAGVPINRRGAHPTGTSQDAASSDPSRPFGVTDPRAVGRPPYLITEETRDLILHDFQECGSARRVALTNGISYWTVLKILRGAGVPLSVGSKPKVVVKNLAGRPLTTAEVTAIQIEVERVAGAGTNVGEGPTLDDIAREFGVSLDTLAAIISLGTGSMAAVARKEKIGAAAGTATVSVADAITAITSEVERRVKSGLDVGLQPPLL